MDHTVFEDIDYCRKTVHEARTIFSSTATTDDEYDKMETVLSLMYLYCPDSFQIVVRATLNEAAMRKEFR